MNKKILIMPLILSILALGSCAQESSSSADLSSSSADLSSSATESSETSSSSSEQYPAIAISAAREAAADETVIVKGTVIAMNYTGQTTPYITGFWMSDGTDTIYVYGETVAKSLSVGNFVKIQGKKGYYIPTNDTEAAKAANYKGQAQISDPQVLGNDGLTTGTIPEAAINTTTVSDLSKALLTTDISGKIYKVKGRYHKYPETGYTNYGIDDLNRVDSLAAYTQSNGKDYAWTDEQDGKAVEMLLVTTLAKPATSEWKFCPIKFLGDVTVTDKQEAEYGAYRASLYFKDSYAVATTLTIAKADEKLSGLTRNYSSSSSQFSVTTTDTDNVVKIAASATESIEIKASATYKSETADYSRTVEVTAKPTIATKTIAEARALADDTEVSVEAVVVAVTYKASMTKQGLFLADATGSLVVYNGTATQANLADVEKGNSVIVTGKMAHYIKVAENATAEGYDGDVQLADVTVDFIDSNAHSIPDGVVSSSTIEDLAAIGPSTNITGKLYQVNGTLKSGAYGSYSLVGLTDTAKSLPFYSQNSGKDFTFLTDYSSKNVTIIIGCQNLNLKATGSFYRYCPITVIGELA